MDVKFGLDDVCGVENLLVNVLIWVIDVVAVSVFVVGVCTVD